MSLFERERTSAETVLYALYFDSLFNANDIDACIADKYDTSDKTCTCQYFTRWLGVDPGFLTSSFGLVITQWRDQKLEIVYENEVKYADPDEMRRLIHYLVTKYSICRGLIDGSSVSLIRQLCNDWNQPDIIRRQDKR